MMLNNIVKQLKFLISCIDFIINKLTIKMQHTKCPMCNRKAVDPINLRCDHHPCFQCASQIVAIDHESPLETKYKIICPVCYKKTITYDLRHLIISMTEQDEDLYVTTKYINKKPELHLTKKGSSTTQASKSTHYSKHNSQNNIQLTTNRTIAVQCKKHGGNNLQYLCEDCFDKNQSDFYLCSQCAKSHKHRLTSIVNAGDKIFGLNQRKKENIFCGKYDFLNTCLSSLLMRKEAISCQFQALYKQVAEQFKILYHYINQQYENVKRDLKAVYNKQCEQIRANIGIVEKLKQSLNELQKIPADNCTQLEAQVHYSMCVSEIQKAIQNNKLKICEKIELPRILKRNQITIGSPQKFIQVLTNIKPKQSSRPVTPSNSARLFNYSFDACKTGRPESRNSDLNYFKQNFNPLSPKNYFSSKPCV